MHPNPDHVTSAFNFPWRAVAVSLAAFGRRGLFIPEASLARPCRHRAAGFFNKWLRLLHGPQSIFLRKKSYANACEKFATVRKGEINGQPKRQ